VLIDASNNTEAGSVLNLAAAREQIPLVCGWVGEMTGYLTTFWPGRGPCLACAMLEPPYLRPALLGPLPGIMGSLQAFEVVRILGCMGPALLGRVLLFEGNKFKFEEKFIRSNPQCPVCSSGAS
jgi:adenylyltransferase/sulfurtransferase